MADMYSTDANSARLAPGTRLNDIFEITGRIASGGMGDIYRGHFIETGDPVAIKVMRTDLADNTMALALFRKEAQSLFNIHNEAIVRYYVFSNDPATGRHYLAMEFVDGEPLSELLHSGPLSVETVTQLQERLASGLQATHQFGIIHRDLSPDNVLIPGGDVTRAKIIDFGIARSTRVGDGTIIGSGFAGKYNYVSPEQLGLFGGNVTAKSDIYSLGLVLAECLLGRALDMGGSQFEVIEKRRSVPDLSAVDSRYRPLLARMLQPDPKDRPESMAEVAAWRPAPTSRPAALTRGRSAPQPPQRPTSAARTPASRRGRLLPVAAAVLLLFGGAGLYFARDHLPVAWLLPSGGGDLPTGPPPLNPGGDMVGRNEPRPDPAKPPEPNIGAGGLTPRERPSSDPRERISQFVNAYDGGDCFFVEPVTVAEGSATLEGYGSSVAPFEVLDYEFKRQNGFEASIGVHQVTPAQCAAVSFLARARKERGTPPRLDISTGTLRSGAALTGSVSGYGDRNVDLVLVGDDGVVQKLTSMLKPNGDAKSFNIHMQKTTPGPGQPQLLLALVSSRPLDALNSSQPATADQVFGQLASTARQGQAINVAARYFKLEN
jgi:serine/threonine-protein kinase